MPASSPSSSAQRPAGTIAPVALIAPFPALAEVGYTVLQDYPQPVEIRVGDMAMGLAEARSLQRNGVEVFISRGGTASLIRDELSLPLVEIRTSSYDVLNALAPLIGSGKRIGLCGSVALFLGAQGMGKLFNMDLRLYPFATVSELADRIRQAKKEDVDVVIGGKLSTQYAKDAGMDTVLLSSGYESMLTAFHEAYHILRVRQAHRHVAETRFDAVMNAVHDAFWILDMQGNIQVSNPSATTLVGCAGDDGPLPLHPPDLLDTICASQEPLENLIGRIGGKPLLLDSVPLETEIPSLLLMGRSVSKVEQSERTLRSAFYNKGHVARYRFSDILGQDRAFLSIIDRGRVYATSSSTVLIIGETGTGKELLAQSIHNECFGGERPFVAINCATLPETLLESELFGYAGGSFTGARQEGRKGLFELAHGGSILLDEIGEMPLPLQSRLLRVLEEKAVRPVGNDRVIPVNVRLMATTNVDLEEAVAEGTFRKDLFYRLNVLSLHLPPLRSRGEDSLHIFRIYVRQRNPDADVDILLDDAGRALLLGHDWPGNLREMRNLVEKLDTLTTGFTRNLGRIRQVLASDLHPRQPAAPPPGDRADILDQLVQCGAIKQHKLAELLGVSRTTLWRRRKKN